MPILRVPPKFEPKMGSIFCALIVNSFRLTSRAMKSHSKSFFFHPFETMMKLAINSLDIRTRRKYRPVLFSLPFSSLTIDPFAQNLISAYFRFHKIIRIKKLVRYSRFYTDFSGLKIMADIAIGLANPDLLFYIWTPSFCFTAYLPSLTARR